MMVLLSGALRDSPTGAKLQALEGWLLLLRALAQHAPTHLGGMANQVAHSACCAFQHKLLPVLLTPPHNSRVYIVSAILKRLTKLACFTHFVLLPIYLSVKHSASALKAFQTKCPIHMKWIKSRIATVHKPFTTVCCFAGCGDPA